MIVVKIIAAIGLIVMTLSLVVAMLGTIISNILEKFGKVYASYIADSIVHVALEILLYDMASALAIVFALKAYDIFLNV